MRLLCLLLLLSLPPSLFAQDARFQGGSISIGDPLAKLLQVAGKPDQLRPFPGSPTATLYEYSVGNRQVNITVRGGKVTGIADNTLVTGPSPASFSGVLLDGGRIVNGDSLQKLQQVGGKPSAVRSFPDRTIYEYASGGREITVTVRDGKVSGTSELKVVRNRTPR